MKADMDAGNYVIAGGDTNMDLLGNSGEIFGVVKEDAWAKTFPKDSLPEGISVVAAFDKADPVPTCRDSGVPYTPGKTFLVSVDGFFVSNNVEVISSEVQDLQFQYSDHNPVEMTFRLVPDGDEE